MTEHDSRKRPPQAFDCVQDYLIARGYAYFELAGTFTKLGSTPISASDIARYSTPLEMDRWLQRREES